MIIYIYIWSKSPFFQVYRVLLRRGQRQVHAKLHLPDGAVADSGAGNASFFGSHSQIRTIVLPRQARDKHKETLIKEAFFPQGDYSCTDLVHNRACWGGNMCNTNCYPTESIANNFIVLRSMTGSRFGNTLYAEFATGNQMQTASKNRSF
jgi:hypothetical protein